MKNILLKICGVLALMLFASCSSPTLAQTESSEENQKKPEPPKVTVVYDDVKGQTKVDGPSVRVVKLESPSEGQNTYRAGVEMSANYIFLGSKPQRPNSVNVRLSALFSVRASLRTDNKMENVTTLYVKYGDKRATFPVVYSREMFLENVGSESLTAMIPTDVFVQIGRSPSVQLQYEVGQIYLPVKGEVTADNMFALRMVVDEIAKAKK